MDASSVAPIRVLVVDDSAAVRAVFSSIIADDPGLELFATAADPYVAVERMREKLPDVILLDLELPRMNGLTFLKKIMSQRPLPVVVCSSHSGEGSESALKALEFGAAEVLAKPRFDTDVARQEAGVRIGDALRAAVSSCSKGARTSVPFDPGCKLSADAILPPLAPRSVPLTMPVVAIGSSTGGTDALREILTALPENAPAILVVQHMPEHFTQAFARRIDGLCRIAVREARDSDVLKPGLALIAPGNHHLMLRRSGDTYRVSIAEGPYVSRHRPSVDVLFRSTAQAAGQNALGIILTGMGDDGATCLGEMRAAGARTIAQDEASSVVWGMPRAAVENGAAECVMPLRLMATEIASFAQAHASRRPASQPPRRQQ